jgi:outer membrane receptor protein involved in Fe transport
MKRLWVFLLVLAMNLGSGFSQNTALVKGRVFDKENGEALPGASVVYQRIKGTTTDQDGYFTLTVTPGNIEISFRYIGYTTLSYSNVIIAGQTIELEIGLEPAVTQIDQVVVSAGKVQQKVGESTVSLTLINPQSYSSAHISDSQELIHKTSGIEVMDGQASVRGGSGFSYGAGSRVLTLVDGLPVLAADAGNIRWQFLPLENISQIEIIKGASSVLYGSSALNGVINFRTAEATSQGRTTWFVESGIFDRPRNRQWVWWDAPRSFYSASFSHLKRYGNTEIGIGSYILFDKGYRRLNEENLGRINMKVIQHHDRVSGLSYGVYLNGGYSEKTDFVLWENATTGALRQNEATATNLHALVYTIDPFVSFKSDENFTHELRTRIQSTSNKFPEGEMTNSNAVSFYSEYQGWYNINHFLNLNTGILQNSSRINSLFYGDHSAMNVAGYIQADISPFERLTLVAGTRLEHNTLNGEADNLTPLFRSGLNYRAFDFTFFRASWGQGYRYPSIAEKFAATTLGSVRVFPSPGIQPESGWNAEAGIKQGVLTDHWNGLIDLALFYSQNKDMIEYGFGNFSDTGSGVSGFGFRAENTEYSRVYGFELEFNMANTSGKFNNNISGGYVYMYPVEFNQLTWENTGVFLKYRRKHSLTLNLDTQYGIFDMGVSIFVKSRILNIDDVFLNEMTREDILPGFYNYWNDNNKGYFLADLNLACRLTSKYRVSLSVKNFTNTEYIGRPGDIQPHRHVSLRFTGQL